jgi:hypothetical protein
MAAVTEPYMSASVAATTRDVNVEAFSSWSACRIRHTSKMRASRSAGVSPLSM